MTIEAKIVAHSRHPMFENENCGPVPDIITYLLRYPRFIHAEVMTHRLFSRNASSSRAIPVKRMIEDVLRDPAMPIHWGKNQRGMQADGENDAPIFINTYFDSDGVPDRHVMEYGSEQAWLFARDRAVEVAQAFDAAGYHKQVVNRLIEPFTHINVVVTATNYANFFWLRRHPDAQPEIKALADAMWDALQASTPRVLQPGEWHMPFVTDEDRDRVEMVYGGNGNVLEIPVGVADLIKVSVARAARTSYLTHDGRVPDFNEDVALYDRLVGSAPLHASPAEHQARADEPLFTSTNTTVWENAHLAGNFDPGWVQYRKTLPGERCDIYEAA